MSAAYNLQTRIYTYILDLVTLVRDTYNCSVLNRPKASMAIFQGRYFNFLAVDRLTVDKITGTNAQP